MRGALCLGGACSPGRRAYRPSGVRLRKRRPDRAPRIPDHVLSLYDQRTARAAGPRRIEGGRYRLRRFPRPLRRGRGSYLGDCRIHGPARAPVFYFLGLRGLPVTVASAASNASVVVTVVLWAIFLHNRWAVPGAEQLP